MTATMPATMELPEVIVEEVPIRRVKDGRPVTSTLFVRFQAEVGPVPATVGIGEGWRTCRETGEQTFKHWASYGIMPVEVRVPGRCFRLVRERASVEKSDDKSPHYTTLIGPTPADDRCDCRGAAATEYIGHRCKHMAAVRWLVEDGYL